jgi:PAS domain S-box-containing protein
MEKLAQADGDVVELHDDHNLFAETVAKFIGGGLGAGEPVIVIATPEHRAAFCVQLTQWAIDVDRACRTGRLTLLDARETLAELMVGDTVDWERFRTFMGRVLDRAGAGRPYKVVRAYGEMVDLLWRDGKRDAAIKLEALWGDLRNLYPFTLRCAYLKDDFYKEKQGEQLSRVLRVQDEPPAGDGTTRTNEKLHESELKMRLLIDSIRDYAIFMLDPTGHIASWNPGAQRAKGYEAAEIIGKHFSIFYPESDVKAGKCELELRGAVATGRFEDEGWRVRKDGSRFWANVVISAVHDETGELIGFAKVTRDLTERRRAEDERTALAAAQQASRAKDEFLAMLGHELRNPLAPIVTALQLMKLRGGVAASNEQIIIERQVQHVVRLVDDLLDVSRITQKKIELKLQTFELATVVAKAVEMASPLIEQRRHTLTIEVPRQGMILTADPTRLAQVIANLLTNAAKYTDSEGSIEIGAWRDGHELVIQVKDNGMGIRPELLAVMFDLFTQGPRTIDRAEGGLGIGLTLVRTLVEMHKGTVVALSDGPGKGSAFVVRLPAGSALAVVTKASRRKAQPHTPRRVLVVDDNVDAAELLAELCEEMGHEVKVAYDGPRALSVLESFTPEIAILDIGLPAMNGYELAKQVRAKLGPACRLIALTGYGQEHDRQRSLEAGFEAHLVKPIDEARLSELMEPAR